MGCICQGSTCPDWVAQASDSSIHRCASGGAAFRPEGWGWRWGAGRRAVGRPEQAGQCKATWQPGSGWRPGPHSGGQEQDTGGNHTASLTLFPSGQRGSERPAFAPLQAESIGGHWEKDSRGGRRVVSGAGSAEGWAQNAPWPGPPGKMLNGLPAPPPQHGGEGEEPPSFAIDRGVQQRLPQPKNVT